LINTSPIAACKPAHGNVDYFAVDAHCLWHRFLTQKTNKNLLLGVGFDFVTFSVTGRALNRLCHIGIHYLVTKMFLLNAFALQLELGAAAT
jgi:hypothetical protein